jgi:hypothetical protein
VGCRSYARDQDDVLITQYGFHITNTTYAGTIDGCSDEGSATPWNISDPTKIISHGGSTTATAHPPVVMTGKIDMSGNFIDGASGVRFQQWNAATIAAGSISVNNNALINLSEAAPTNLTDIAYASTGVPVVTLRNIGTNAITVVHNTSKLRLNSGADITLAQHQAIAFTWVSGTVWQHTGGKQA